MYARKRVENVKKREYEKKKTNFTIQIVFVLDCMSSEYISVQWNIPIGFDLEISMGESNEMSKMYTYVICVCIAVECVLEEWRIFILIRNVKTTRHKH